MFGFPVLPFLTALFLPSLLVAQQSEVPKGTQYSTSKVVSTSRDSRISEHPVGPQLPVVVYQDGELTINAENVLLTDILTELRQSMGAQIEIVGADPGHRIWTHLGPGPARRIVSDLLSGTEFNYVIQGSVTDPDGIRSVMLSPHAKSPGNEGQGAYVAQAQRFSNNRSVAGTAETSVDTVASAAPAESNTSAEASSPEDPPSAAAKSASVGPQISSAVGSSPSLSQDNPSTPNPIVGSSDQIAQQLQSMYQQRRQLQMIENQQNQKVPSNPNQ